MKILFLCGYYPIMKGGSENQAYNIAQYMKKEHEIVFVSPNADCDEAIEDNGMKIYKLKQNYISSRLTYDKADMLRTILANESPDAVYNRVLTALSGVAAKHCREYNKHFVWHIASMAELVRRRNLSVRYMFHEMRENRLKEQAKRLSSAVIAQAEYQKAMLGEALKVKTAVVRNFYTEESDISENEGKTRVIWLSNVKRIKRVEILFRIAGLLENRTDIEFILAGRNANGAFGKYVRESAERANIKMTGELTRKEVSALLKSGDIMLNTSEMEGFPNSFIEAWLAGLKVVSISVNPDKMLKGRLGYEAGDEHKAADYIAGFADNAEKHRNDRSGIRAFAIATFNPEKNIRAISNIICNNGI